MRFIERLPIIDTVLPLCEKGTDISISYYLFNKNTREENPTGEGLNIMNYAYETAYAYRQLIAHTNIRECGQVRIFMDKRCEAQMRTYFEQIGLDSLISIIDVEVGVQLAGYIPCLDHPDVADCRYRFHNDSDLWWTGDDSEQFDWTEFCKILDETDDTLYGQEIEKPKWVYQINYSQHALPEDVQRESKITLKKIFGLQIPKAFVDIAFTDHDVLRKQNEMSDLKCIGGWFVGVRKDSQTLRELTKLYEAEKRLTDDEGLFALFFCFYPDIGHTNVLQGHWEQRKGEIRQIAISNYNELEGKGTINVGSQEFYESDWEGSVNELVQHFAPQVAQKQDKITEPEPQILQTFGEHIIGTYALDPNGREFPLLSHSKNTHSTLFGFPAAFRPITYPLRATTEKNPKVEVFYCLAYHPIYTLHDLHVYAKSMIYAYKTLIKQTNILDCGKVCFYIDDRIIDTVRPYCEHANIDELIVTYKSEKNIHYAAYIPYFYRDTTGIKYKFYMDVDMWWVNLTKAPQFDFIEAVNKMNEAEADVFGLTVPKSQTDINADLYIRCIYDKDTHTEHTKEWMQEHFEQDAPPPTDRNISGCFNSIPCNDTILELLESFYKETGNFIRDDEAFWTAFLSRYNHIKISNLENIISGTGFSKTEIEHHDKPEVAHVGTYMFEHFYNKPEAKSLFTHFNE